MTSKNDSLFHWASVKPGLWTLDWTVDWTMDLNLDWVLDWHGGL